MHIEPGVVDGAKMALAYTTAAGVAGYTVKESLADLAESKLDQFKYADAKKYLQRGLTVQPDNARLQELQKKANSFLDLPKRIWNKIRFEN